MADTSSIAIATNIFTAPNKAFAALRERSLLLLPLLVLIVGPTVTSFEYFSKVDLAWMMDTTLQQAQANNPQITDAQRHQVADAVGRIPPSVRGAGAAIFAT